MMYKKSKAKQTYVDSNIFREKVSKTLFDMASIVGSTMGPAGRAVLIERDDMPPLATKDGVTVVKSLGVADPLENIIVDACKEISINTANEAGDGTTTAIVLGSALVEHGQKFIASNPKYNPQKIINELKWAYNNVAVPYLKSIAIPAKTQDQLLSVALISSNNDREVAEAATRAVIGAGDDGHVLIVEGKKPTIEVETSDGYIVTTGLKELKSIGPAFINNKAEQEVSLNDGLLFLYNGTMSDLKALSHLQACIESTGGHDGSPIVVVAHDFGDVVLEKCLNSCKGGAFVVPMRSPRSGLPNGAAMFLDDLAAYSSATVYDPTTIADIDYAGLGTFSNVTMNLYESFVQCTPDVERVDSRVQELKAIYETASELDRAHLRAAIAKLTCGISTVKVGGTSDLEIRERKARVEDAVEAVKSAISEGIVTGGCTMHIRIMKMLLDHPDRKSSWSILENALMRPASRLFENCGEDPAEILDVLCTNEGHENMGQLPHMVFDAYTHTYQDPLKYGIIEPAKVVRVSIGNALSVASLIMSLGGVVVGYRDAALEAQLEMADSAFKNMLNSQEQ